MSHWLRLHWLQPSATKMQDILQALATYHHILRMFLRLRLNVLTVHSSPRAGPPLLLRPFMWLSRSWKQINCLKTIRAVASANVFAHAVAPGWVMGACHILKEAKNKPWDLFWQQLRFIKDFPKLSLGLNYNCWALKSLSNVDDVCWLRLLMTCWWHANDSVLAKIMTQDVPRFKQHTKDAGLAVFLVLSQPLLPSKQQEPVAATKRFFGKGCLTNTAAS